MAKKIALRIGVTNWKDIQGPSLKQKSEPFEQLKILKGDWFQVMVYI